MPKNGSCISIYNIILIQEAALV